MKRRRGKGLITIPCIQCGRDTKHKPVRTYDTTGGDENFSLWHEFSIIECAGCGLVSFMENRIFSEDYDTATGELDSTIYLYPHRDEHTLPVKLFEHVPERLRRIYAEVVNTFNGGMYILCAGGLRSLVEGICAERRIRSGNVRNRKTGKVERKKNLEGMINGLVHGRVLTKKHAEILHKHRFLGNAALHELDMPSRESLAAAIQILEHTMENVYEIGQTAKLVKVRK